MSVSLLLATALGQSPTVPRRRIPPTVLAELQELDNRFQAALAEDCAPGRCYPKGCTYLDHATADRPRRSSLPGLGAEPGPTPEMAQHFLTRASCSFAHEEDVTGAEAAALVRRLQARLSRGWLAVSVRPAALPPLHPDEAEEAPPAAEAPPPPDPDWGRELWTTLLPHFAWMLAIALSSLAAMALIWAWRRLGRASLEEQMLLAQLANEAASEPDETPPSTIDEPDEATDDPLLAQRRAAWMERVRRLDPEDPDPEIRALLRQLLRERAYPLLAKALLELPGLHVALPAGAAFATAKLELSAYLKEVDPADLPEDGPFYAALHRHALAAAVANQSDAELARILREEFGAAGLAELIGQLPPRAGGLLFTLAPLPEQRETVRLLNPETLEAIAEQLLLSNRMSPEETQHLFQVLAAVRDGEPLPPPPSPGVSERGMPIEAASALSVLLPRLAPASRQRLFRQVLDRFNGTFPSWYRDLLYPELLQRLDDEDRADLLLGIDGTLLAAWFALLEPDQRDRSLERLPDALRRSIRTGAPLQPDEQIRRAERARQELARGLQAVLARRGTRLEDWLVEPTTP